MDTTKIRDNMLLRRVSLCDVRMTMPVASSETEHACGLMGATKVGPGMLFEHRSNSTSGFWTKDTYVAIDLAYVTSEGHIFQISRMEPMSEKVVLPRMPYRWAVEMASGWFDALPPGSPMTLSMV